MNPADRNTSNTITEGSLTKAIVGLTTPMLVSGILQNVQTLIDLFWVGRLGPVAVASVAMSGTILMVLFPMLMGLSTGTVALVARAVGAQRYDHASEAAGQSLMLALVFGILSGWVGWHISDGLLHLLGAAPDVIAGGAVYLRIFLAGSFTVYVLFIGNASLQGAGDARTPMVVMVIANILNIILDPLFIFGLGPLPRMGVAGAALATVLSQAIAAAISVAVLLGGKARLHVRRRHWTPQLPLAWRILRIGIPGSGQMLSRSLMSLVLMRIVAGFGTLAVAAYGTCMRFHMILLMPAFALGASAATMMGQNLGAGKPARARKAIWMAAWFDVGLMAVSAAVLMGFARPLIHFFNTDAEVIRIGARYLHVVSPFYVFAAFGIVLGRGLNGAGDTVAPMIITILGLWGLQVPLALYLPRIIGTGPEGVWWAMAVAFVVQAALMIGWFETGRWRHARV